VLDYPEANQFYSFFRALEEGSPPTPDVQDGWNALELALAIQRSSATGQPVRLPLE
jgi:predicted dehydrogenase